MGVLIRRPQTFGHIVYITEDVITGTHSQTFSLHALYFNQWLSGCKDSLVRSVFKQLITVAFI